LQKLYKKKLNKIGILGGTFDPPHHGHLYISKIAITKLKLNKLIWSVTKKNPLKQKPFLSLKERVRLSKKITTKNKKIFVQSLDAKIKSINTYNLLNYIKMKHKNSILYFLIGADNLVKFNKWKNWKKIPKIAKIVVFPRKDYSIKYLKIATKNRLDKKDWIYIKSKKINISSSLIRKFW